MRLKSTITNVILALVMPLTSAAALSAPVYAAPAAAGGGGGAAAAAAAPPTTCPAGTTAKGQVLQGLGQTGSNCSDDQVNGTIQTAVDILSMVVGIASVIVIVISGFKYIASGGEQNKVSNAKNSLIYALIGLAVAATAQLLIHFVLYNTN